LTQPIRLLLVEDSEDDALLLMREIRLAGFDAETTRVDTLRGLETALESQDWDVVVSDYALPSFDGLTALEMVQNAGIDLPFIVVSGTIGEDVAVAAMRAGAHDYVMKDRLARLGPAIQRELREAEDRRARRRAEQAYRSLVEGSLQGFVILLDGAIAFVNPAFAGMLGYSVEEMQSFTREHVSNTIHPDDRDMVWQRYAARLAGEEVPPRYEIRMFHRSGEVRWMEMVATRIEFDGRPATQANLVDITERVRHEREQRALVTVATSLRMAMTRQQMVDLLLEEVRQLFDADGTALVVCDPEGLQSTIELGTGIWVKATGDVIPAGKGLTGRIVEDGCSYVNNDVRSDAHLAWNDILATTRAVAGVPLITGETIIGVLWLGRDKEINEDDCLLLTAIGELTASALLRLILNEQLERTNQELTDAYDRTLEGWARALELRDGTTEDHTRRVADLAERLGSLMGFENDDLVHLRRGALLHDIGKMAIPDNILRKAGPLSEDEWTIMRRHPDYAFEMLSKIPFLASALEIPYCHHERWDGTGYPRGLKGAGIPIAARIFAVIDVWDALGSNRPYRDAWPTHKVITYIRDHAGSHFDPSVVEIFLNEVCGAEIQTPE